MLPETFEPQVKARANKNKVFRVVFGAFFMARAVLLLWRGHDSIVSVTEHPAGYWIVVAVCVLGSAAFFLTAFQDRKT
jgi:hypothetical protein